MADQLKAGLMIVEKQTVFETCSLDALAKRIYCGGSALPPPTPLHPARKTNVVGKVSVDAHCWETRGIFFCSICFGGVYKLGNVWKYYDEKSCGAVLWKCY